MRPVSRGLLFYNRGAWITERFGSIRTQAKYWVNAFEPFATAGSKY
jgi:hypothetical protein